MKAVVIKESNDIRFEKVKDVYPNDYEVKVNVKYTGICGSDVPRALNNGAHNYPIILGHEFSGVVSEVGKKVTTIKVGDHVVGIPLIPCMECDDCQKGNYSLCKHYNFVGSRRDGSMAEYIVLPSTNVFVIDKSIPLLSAAFFEPSTIAYHGIMQNNINISDQACVIGNGNIGNFVIEWLKNLGVKDITVIGRNEQQLPKTKKYGATQFVNINNPKFADIINDITSNKGFPNVIVCTNSIESIKLSFNISSNKGHICFVGTPSSEVNFTVKEWEILNRKELTITGSWMSYSKEFPGIEWIQTNKAFASGNILIDDDRIYKVFPMKECHQAFDQFKNSVSGKIIIENEYFKM